MVHEMSYDSVSNVVDTWDQIRSMPDFEEKVGTALFKRFFDMDHTAAGVFSFGEEVLLDDDFYKQPRLASHAKYFIRMIDRAINLLGPDIEMLTEVLGELGKKHRAYGVKPSHFPVMGTALIETLEEFIGDSFDESMKDSWLEVYHALAYDMIRSLNGEVIASIHPGRRSSAASALYVSAQD